MKLHTTTSLHPKQDHFCGNEISLMADGGDEMNRMVHTSRKIRNSRSREHSGTGSAPRQNILVTTSYRDFSSEKQSTRGKKNWTQSPSSLMM